MAEYKSSDIQSVFSISHETVRQWSMRFSAYLSPGANPPKDRHRVFSSDDLRVFALIDELKKQGKTYDDIDLSLGAGSRGDLPIVVDNHSTALERTLKLDQALAHLETLQTERDQAVQVVGELKEEVIKLKTQLEFYTSQGDKIDELNKQIGRLETLLEIERDRNKHDDTD